ncbi:MAG: 2OG-Fe(II) oxygenase [Alphaproteobacteria bacterium]|nr:2OG-Fe(II) oxygenase [Alphaproteobacteria bacterium]
MDENRIEDIVNLAKYPILDNQTDAYKQLVARMAAQYSDNSACLLSDFLLPQAVNAMAAEAHDVSKGAFRCDDHHNCYLEKDDPSFAIDHPRRKLERTTLNVVGCDQLYPSGALVTLYKWDPLRRFIADILGYRALYRLADPMGAMTINVMNEGDNHGWHYDEALFTVSVMLQAPENGGEFEYVPGLRSDTHDDYEGLDNVLNGAHTNSVKIPITPGALLLFGGHYLLHRVTNVKGDKTRYITTLCYRDRPGVTNSPKVRELFYGRQEPIYTHDFL